MVAWVEPGQEFRIECVDWTGGQIKNDDSAADVKIVDLTKVHYLSGPVGVKGAEPGDLLVCDILDVGVLPTSQWGFTGIFAKENGGGFLTEHYPEARKACWNFSGIYANSRHIPNVEFAGIMHPGLIGCLPSAELLAKWNKREAELFNTNPERVPALCALPYGDTAQLSVPTLSSMVRSEVIARDRNERSRYEPRIASSPGSCSHAGPCNHGRKAKPGQLKAYKGKRPWVIEHA